MGTRENKVEVLESTKDLKTGAKVKSFGLGMNIAPKQSKAEKIEQKESLIEIDLIKTSRLIDLTVEDLTVKRLMKVNGVDTEIVFIREYNRKSRIIKFNYHIADINRLLGINEPDLSDFFLTFMFNNIRAYVRSEWGGIPENLPILSIEEASLEIPNTIIVNIR